MSINVDNIAVIETPVSPNAAFQVTIDISDWLDTDTINSVAYSAVDGNGASNTWCLDTTKCTNTNTIIKPYIKGKTSGERYTVKCLVTTTGGDKESWYLKFACREYAA